MGLALFKDRRGTARRRLTGLMPGRLTIKASHRSISGKPVDISRNGLGILMSEELEPGTELVLHVGDRMIELVVSWGQPDFGKLDMYRYGLILVDPAEDLEAEFITSGCLI